MCWLNRVWSTKMLGGAWRTELCSFQRPGSTVSPWLLPCWASLLKAQFHQFSLGDQSKCQACCFYSSLSAPGTEPLPPHLKLSFRAWEPVSGLSIAPQPSPSHFILCLNRSSLWPFQHCLWPHHARMMIHQPRHTSPYLLSCPPGRQNFSLLLQCQISHVWICLTSWKLYSFHQITILNLFTNLSLQALLFFPDTGRKATVFFLGQGLSQHSWRL